MWKFIKDVYTVSYFVLDMEVYNVYWIWKFIMDVYTISYFVTGLEDYKRRIHCFILCNGCGSL